jgi:hypothetical protein
VEVVDAVDERLDCGVSPGSSPARSATPPSTSAPMLSPRSLSNVTTLTASERIPNKSWMQIVGLHPAEVCD